MKKQINVKFITYSKFPYPKQIIKALIEKNFAINETDRPDYLINLGHVYKHHWYDDCIKVLIDQECISCDFNQHDYIVGFDDLTFGDRYLRVPLFARWPTWQKFLNRPRISDSELVNRPFCSAVISNSSMGDPFRREFIERLAKYKPIAMGGRYKNNVGGPVRDKVDFCRGYKFNLALENCSSAGYTTEKIMEAYAANAIPIYFGNPQIEKDCRLESMVRIKDRDDVERAISEIIRIDQDDAAYLKVARVDPFVEPDVSVYTNRLEEFLFHIFDQPLSKARRRNITGYQHGIQHHVSRVMRLDYRVLSAYTCFQKWLASLKSSVKMGQHG